MTQPDARMRYVLAADIGATSIRAGIVGRDGHVIARSAIATEPAHGLPDAALRLVRLFHTLTAGAGVPPVEAIGIATAGPIDPISGTYRSPPNLPGWDGASMRPSIEAAFRLPLALGHDATLAAIAETAFGAHAGARHLVYLTVSTGIGAGIVVDGRPITGQSGGAGEAGHMIVSPGGPPCGSGCSGCLEAVASGTGIASRARSAVTAGIPTALPPDPTAADVFAAAEAGDAVAGQIVDSAIGGLAIGLANLLAVLDPEVIVLGGGVLHSLERRWDALIARTTAVALPRYAHGVPVERTVLADDASLLGAALIAFGRIAR